MRLKHWKFQNFHRQMSIFALKNKSTRSPAIEVQTLPLSVLYNGLCVTHRNRSVTKLTDRSITRSVQTKDHAQKRTRAGQENNSNSTPGSISRAKSNQNNCISQWRICAVSLQRHLVLHTTGNRVPKARSKLLLEHEPIGTLRKLFCTE